MASSLGGSSRRATQPLGTFVLRGNPAGLSRRFSQYSIVGKYVDSGPLDFVRHVAILKDDVDLAGPADVEVYHMGPPVVAGEGSASVPFSKRSCRTDLVADLAIDAEEREAIEDWLAEVEKEDRKYVKPFQQYVVIPHVTWVWSPENGRRLRRRFSCAGFVIECFRAAAVDLIDTSADMPEVDAGLLEVAYPDLVGLQNADDRIKERVGFKGRDDLGLPGNGPWRAVLAGYVFHSLNRVTSANPRPGAHVPTSTREACFTG